MSCKERRKTKAIDLDEACNICGDIGYMESLLTCFQCKRAREHLYCMRAKLKDFEEKWICEACQLIDGIISSKAPISNSFGIACQENKDSNAFPFKMVPKDILPSVDPSGLLEDVGKGAPCKKQKNVPKAKFIPAEEASTLASGAETEAVVLQEKETSAIPNHRYACKGEPIVATSTGGDVGTLNVRSEGGILPADLKFKISEANEVDNPGMSKIEGDCPNLPALGATWMGSFKILDMDFSGNSYEGLQAHPPCKVSRKAYEASKRMPQVLQFNLHPRRDLWVEMFQKDSPAENDIALYFFPSNSGRSKKDYIYLLELIEISDLVMRSWLGGAELLVFTSKQLPAASQRLNTELYLWGIFRRVKCGNEFFKSHGLLSSLFPLGNVHKDCVPFLGHCRGNVTLNTFSNDSDAILDKETDVFGGKGVGRFDKTVQIPCEGKRVQFKSRGEKGKDQINSQGHVSSNACKKYDQPCTRRNRSTSAVNGSHDSTSESYHHSRYQRHGHRTKAEASIAQYSSNIKREPWNDLDVPPGFSRQLMRETASEQDLVNLPIQMQTLNGLDVDVRHSWVDIKKENWNELDIPSQSPTWVTSAVNRERPLLKSTARVPTVQGHLDVSPRFWTPRYDVNNEKEKASVVGWKDWSSSRRETSMKSASRDRPKGQA